MKHKAYIFFSKYFVIIAFIIGLFFSFYLRAGAQSINSYERIPSGTPIDTGSVTINYTMTFSDVVGGYSVYLYEGLEEIEIGRVENCYENDAEALTVSGTSNFTVPNGDYEVVLVGYYSALCNSFQEQVLLPITDVFTVEIVEFELTFPYFLGSFLIVILICWALSVIILGVIKTTKKVR